MSDSTHQRTNYKPNFWGPCAWRFLHVVAAGMPEKLNEQEQNNARKFFEILPFLLPCEKCRIHLQEHFSKQFPSVKTRREIVQSIFNLHNEVNLSVGKERYNGDLLASFPYEQQPAGTSWALVAGILVVVCVFLLMLAVILRRQSSR